MQLLRDETKVECVTFAHWSSETDLWKSRRLDEIPVGTCLGRYEILAPIAAGGMGQVYRAIDNRLGRHVAVKVLPAEVSNNREWRERFKLEARTLASLNHPNIIAVYD